MYQMLNSSEQIPINHKILKYQEMKKIKCTILTHGELPAKIEYYFCSTCDQNTNQPICKECTKVCHEGHNISKQKYLNNQICYCGKKGHIIEKCEVTNYDYDQNCFIFEIMKKAKMNYYYTDDEYKICFFCRKFCFNYNAFRKVYYDNSENNFQSCECIGHSDKNFIYRAFNHITKELKGEIEPNQLLNLMFCNTSKIFWNLYQNIDSDLAGIKDPNFNFGSNFQFSNLYKTVENISNILRDGEFFPYYNEMLISLIDIEMFIKVMENPLDDSKYVWTFKNNLITIFHKIYIESMFISYPKSKILDFLNISPFIRLINSFEALNYFKSKGTKIKTLLSQILNFLHKILTLKSFRIVGFEMIIRLLSIYENFAKLNLIDMDINIKFSFFIEKFIPFLNQLMKKYSQASFELLIRIKNKVVFTLKIISRILLYIAVNYNDDKFHEFVTKNISLNKLVFFQQTDFIGKLVLLRAIDILAFIRNLTKEHVDQEFVIKKPSNDQITNLTTIKKNNTTISDLSSIRVDDSQNDQLNNNLYQESIVKINNYLNKILSIFFNETDIYLISLNKILTNINLSHKFTKLIKNEISSEQKLFLKFCLENCDILENNIIKYSTYKITIVMLVKKTVEITEKILEKINFGDNLYQNINLLFSEGRIENTEEIKLNKSNDKKVENDKNFQNLINFTPLNVILIKILVIFYSHCFEESFQKFSLEKNLLETTIKSFYCYSENNYENGLSLFTREIILIFNKVSFIFSEQILNFFLNLIRWIGISNIEVVDISFLVKNIWKICEKTTVNIKLRRIGNKISKFHYFS